MREQSVSTSGDQNELLSNIVTAKLDESNITKGVHKLKTKDENISRNNGKF